MVNPHTITSLAILKVHFDEYGSDYLDHLLPFARYVIAKSQLQAIGPGEVSDLIENEFGLIVPEFVCDSVLKRLCKPQHRYLKRESKSYIVLKSLDTTTFEQRKEAVTQTVDSLVATLSKKANSDYGIETDPPTWQRVILAFLEDYSIDCVRAYSVSSPLLNIELVAEEKRLLYVVAKTLEDLRSSNDPLWNEFESIVKGRLLVNALVCDDLAKISQKYQNVTFYIDTPMALSLIGLDEDCNCKCAEQLVELVTELGGKWRVFNHTVEEIQSVIAYSSNNLFNSRKPSRVSKVARSKALSQSDLELIRGKVEVLLNRKGVLRSSTPKYVKELQISEADLALAIEGEVRYMNPRALEYDINSIRSIVVLRNGAQPHSLESSGHIFVSPNYGLVRTAWRFAKQEHPSAKIGAAISDYSLMNISWLKRPMAAPNVASIELTASCYAAMEPKEPLWAKYHDEIERLRAKGDITEDDHYLLRFSPHVQLELMDLTQGIEVRLTSEKIPEILNRVKEDLIRSEKEKLNSEKTRSSGLEQIISNQDYIIKNRCKSIAKIAVAACNTLLVLFLTAAAIIPLFGSKWSSGFFWGICIAVGVLFGLLNAVFGLSVVGLGAWLRRRLESRLISFFKGESL